MLTRREERRARPPIQFIFEDLTPPEEWVQEPSNHILRLSLPQAFKKEELDISYDQSGKITVRGTKQTGEFRYVTFQSSYKAPQDSNFEKVSEKLENNILSLTIPRIIKRKPSEDKKEEPVMKEAMQRINEKTKEEPMKTTMVMKESITKAEHLLEQKEELQTAKERNAEERKDEAILNEKKKASKEKEKPRYCHEAEVGEKKSEVKERNKRIWVWKEEEDKGWLDWMDSGFIEEVLEKVYRNKK